MSKIRQIIASEYGCFIKDRHLMSPVKKLSKFKNPNGYKKSNESEYHKKPSQHKRSNKLNKSVRNKINSFSIIDIPGKFFNQARTIRKEIVKQYEPMLEEALKASSGKPLLDIIAERELVILKAMKELCFKRYYPGPSA